VAICAVAQTKFEASKRDMRAQGLLWEVVQSVREQTGLDFGPGGIGGAVTVSDDVFDARTISDGAITDVVGAHYGSEEKVAADGAQGVYYAAATILSGHHDVVLLTGHCKESQAASRNMVTHLAFDPFYTRPVGLDYLCAAALQAQAYLARSGITETQLADLVVRARQWAARNPVAQETRALTREEVLASPMMADPIRNAFMYPVSDGAIAMILASEKRARSSPIGRSGSPGWAIVTTASFSASGISAVISPSNAPPGEPIRWRGSPIRRRPLTPSRSRTNTPTNCRNTPKGLDCAPRAASGSTKADQTSKTSIVPAA
jgi:acetyl-CoA acetyltransferase